ncbi:hypothetical protein FGO68_gene5591 [Halteria grandinella]|uniref:Uncharacterized protein n=1 Tax=Halteria grandinella TaxID=5974 RepID=A0A8J8NVP3_HALGN|nr:hypothetical protein FGO68_gene5591 [Halteria grandinella]
MKLNSMGLQSKGLRVHTLTFKKWFISTDKKRETLPEVKEIVDSLKPFHVIIEKQAKNAVYEGLWHTLVGDLTIIEPFISQFKKLKNRSISVVNLSLIVKNNLDALPSIMQIFDVQNKIEISYGGQVNQALDIKRLHESHSLIQMPSKLILVINWDASMLPAYWDRLQVIIQPFKKPKSRVVLMRMHGLSMKDWTPLQIAQMNSSMHEEDRAKPFTFYKDGRYLKYFLGVPNRPIKEIRSFMFKDISDFNNKEYIGEPNDLTGELYTCHYWFRTYPLLSSLYNLLKAGLQTLKVVDVQILFFSGISSLQSWQNDMKFTSRNLVDEFKTVEKQELLKQKLVFEIFQSNYAGLEYFENIHVSYSQQSQFMDLMQFIQDKKILKETKSFTVKSTCKNPSQQLASVEIEKYLMVLPPQSLLISGQNMVQKLTLAHQIPTLSYFKEFAFEVLPFILGFTKLTHLTIKEEEEDFSYSVNSESQVAKELTSLLEKIEQNSKLLNKKGELIIECVCIGADLANQWIGRFSNVNIRARIL